MWPFSQKKTERDRIEARNDSTSLGNLLLKAGMITAIQLHEALEFQDQNPDVMLGEALINMGVSDRGIIEALLVSQKAKRGGHQDVAEVIRFAAKHVRSSKVCHTEVRAAAMRLNGKPTKA